MFLSEKMELYPFSPNERHIVNYLLATPHAIEDQTTAQIAQATFSSKSALVRLAQKLDFKGWVDFKKAFLEEIRYLEQSSASSDANLPFDATDNLATIASKIAHLEKEAIDDTQALLDPKTLRQVTQLLNTSETIHLFAVSNNLHNSQEFVHNMNRIQKDVRLHSLEGESVFGAYLAKPKSCAIVLTYSGETRLLLRILQLLKDQSIPIILMTSLGENSSTPYADHILRLATREKLYSKIGTFSTDTSIAYLLNVLYASVFAQNYQQNLDLRISASRAIEYERTSDSDILAER